MATSDDIKNLRSGAHFIVDRRGRRWLVARVMRFGVRLYVRLERSASEKHPREIKMLQFSFGIGFLGRDEWPERDFDLKHVDIEERTDG
jgi:hypothetical protein